MNKKMLYATVTFAIVVVSLTLVYAIAFPATVPTSGVGGGSYAVTLDPETIDWGTVEIGVPVSKIMNITNTGTKHIASLNMIITDPVNITDFTLVWDQESTALPVGDSVIANFTLTSNEVIEGPFSFNIVIDEGA